MDKKKSIEAHFTGTDCSISQIFLSFQNRLFSVYVIISKFSLFPVRDLTHLTLRNMGDQFFPI